MKTLVNLLSRRAENCADQLLYSFLDASCDVKESFTYQAFIQRVIALGTQLKMQSLKGERALLFYPTSADYVIAFFACLYAGVIAVPLYPPRKNRSIDRIAAIIKDAQPAVILSTTAIAEDTRSQFVNTAYGGIRWIATDTVQNEQHLLWQPADIAEDDIAFLQYTSGSTGQPKGVVLTHQQLLANEEMIHEFCGRVTAPTLINWLPLYHDMGLIGNLLYALYAGGNAYLLSPFDFLQKPFRWLQAISRYQGDFSGGPNFAYEECVKRILPEQLAQLDLSSWQMAFNGAETLSADTLARFADTFGPVGFNKAAFKPCYGMAEATLIISGLKPANPPVLYTADAVLLEKHVLRAPAAETTQRVQLVSCGRPVFQEVIITHIQDEEALPEEQVGEIWVQGPHVARGYWNNEEMTAATFHACLKDGRGPFLRTGDLGFMKDGALYVTGRKKELIIIRGRNIYPQDVERVAGHAHEMLESGSGAAFSVTEAGVEKLVVVYELKRQFSNHTDTTPAIQAVRAAIIAHFDIPPAAIVLIRKGALLRTSSGKIQRNACRQAFLSDNGLEVVAAWREGKSIKNAVAAPEPALTAKETTISYSIIVELLKEAIAAYAGIPIQNIGERDTFEQLGLDSMGAVQVAAALEQSAGLAVIPTMVYDYPNISALAAALAGMELTHSASVSGTLSDHLPDGPVAIIGMGCRLPGADGIDAYWELLQNGRSAISKVPDERWLLSEDDRREVGEMVSVGGFLEDITHFDAAFFGITDPEARKMDPQQRLLLEISWQAFEHAGIIPSILAGQQVGVFVGISAADYSRLHVGTKDLDSYYGTGNAGSIAANRLSYYYDFRGPSLAIDTACSSSLVAIHQACKSLRQGECKLALAAGVNVMASPDLSIVFARAGMLSPDGICKTFDDGANGYVRGEGAAVLLLKPLSAAVSDGDTIYGVIRGTAINQDGRSNGLTAPNGPAQEAVIRAALADAGITPLQVNLVEAHGTGTSLGDPIEMNTLLKVYTADRDPKYPFYAGAVKTNIGHLEAAAGIAGLLKALLCLRHQVAVPHLHLQALNHKITDPGERCVIPQVLTPLPASGKPLYAGVSSFGFGGTNAHVILEGRLPTVAVPADENEPLLVVLSAADQQVLREQVKLLQTCLRQQPKVSLRDLAGSLWQGRERLAYCKTFIATSITELQEKLQEYLELPEESPVSKKWASSVPRLCFLFTGQGAQYEQMGRQLYETEEVFRLSFDQCSRLLEPMIGLSLTKLLYEEKDQERIHHTAITQPLLVAFEISLARLWASRGVVPQAVMGHSVGEIAAAHIAGVFSLEDALLLIAYRGRFMQALPAGGQMWAVSAPADVVLPILQPFAGEVTVASFNAPQQLVISGHQQALTEPLRLLAAQGIRTVQLKVSHAFHSPLMQPAMAPFRESINQIKFNMPRIPLLSNVTGTWADENICTPDYWVQHILAPVLFSQGIAGIAGSFDICCEIGPHPVLTALARQSPACGQLLLLSGIIKGSDNRIDLLRSLGELHAAGYPLDKTKLYPPGSFNRCALPVYPFRKVRHWLDTNRGAIAQSLPAIQAPVAKAGEVLFTKTWELSPVAAIPKAKHREQLLVIFTDQPLPVQLLQQGVIDADSVCLVVPDALMALSEGADHELYSLETLDKEGYNGFLQQLTGSGKVPCTLLVAMNAVPVMDDDPAAVNGFLQLAALRLSKLLTAISQCSFQADTTRLLLVTPFVEMVKPGLNISPSLAVLHGMLRAAQHELPEIHCRNCMINVEQVPAWEKIFTTELADTVAAETEVAYVDGERWVARLRQKKMPVQLTPGVKGDKNACWLITGANSSLIKDLVAWLTSCGVRHFLLVSRGMPVADQLEQLQALIHTADGSVRWCCADITRHGVVETLEQNLRETGRPLQGIVHLAGMLKDMPLFQLSPDDLEQVFAPKITGTLHLHALSLHHQPAYFICFSSLAALLGAPYQVNYAGANAFMDAFADWRIAQGWPAISVNWGPWEGEGMAKNAAVHKLGGVEILHKTSAALNYSVLDLALGVKIPHPAVIHFDAAVAAEWAPKTPFFQYLQEGWQQQGKTAVTPSGTLMERLQVDTEEALEAKIRQIILRELKEILVTNTQHPVNTEDTFFALGMDSVMTVSLQQRLHRSLQVNFSVAAVYNYNTVSKLAAFIASKAEQRVTKRMRPPHPPVFTVKVPKLHEVEAMSEEEALILLEDLLHAKNI